MVALNICIDYTIFACCWKVKGRDKSLCYRYAATARRLQSNNARCTQYNILTWTLIPQMFVFPYRYSHTAHIVEDQLLLVGGVQPASDTPPSLTLIHLVTGALQEINLKVNILYSLRFEPCLYIK